jgi:hypothetical protein
MLSFRSSEIPLPKKLDLLNSRKQSFPLTLFFSLMFKHFVGVELLDEETALIDAWLS